MPRVLWHCGECGKRHLLNHVGVGALYRLRMRAIHRLGLCAPEEMPVEPGAMWCTWCGLRGRRTTQEMLDRAAAEMSAPKPVVPKTFTVEVGATLAGEGWLVEVEAVAPGVDQPTALEVLEVLAGARAIVTERAVETGESL